MPAQSPLAARAQLPRSAATSSCATVDTRRVSLLLAAVSAAALGVLLAACTTGGALAARDNDLDRDLNRIEHVVVIYAENRSFDNLYGLFPRANAIAGALPENTFQRR